MAGDMKDVLALLLTLRPVTQAVVNPDACLIKVRLLLPIYNSSKRAEPQAY
jgi:hypothetical protein